MKEHIFRKYLFHYFFFLEFFLRTLLREQIYFKCKVRWNFAILICIFYFRETGSAERTRTQLGVLNTATTSLEYITRNWNQHFSVTPCQVFCYALVKYSVTPLSSILLPPYQVFCYPLIKFSVTPLSSFLLPPCQVFCYPLVKNSVTPLSSFLLPPCQVFSYPLVKYSVTPLSSILLPPCQVFC